MCIKGFIIGGVNINCIAVITESLILFWRVSVNFEEPVFLRFGELCALHCHTNYCSIATRQYGVLGSILFFAQGWYSDALSIDIDEL